LGLINSTFILNQATNILTLGKRYIVIQVANKSIESFLYLYKLLELAMPNSFQLNSRPSPLEFRYSSCHSSQFHSN